MILLIGASALALSLPLLWARLKLSRAKHRSLAGHARIARRVARQIPAFFYNEEEFYGSDGAEGHVVACRRAGFDRLAEIFHTRFAHTAALTREAAESLPDLAFTSRYRVPFPYAHHIRNRLGYGAFLEASEHASVRDLDGNIFSDLGGSYGLNLFGYNVLKACIAEGGAEVGDLGPVLGAYHPVVADNVRRLRAVSGHDAVSFHMSGTEAVMQAARLAQYHTGRSCLVRFCGAYHGWWGDVQPGPGNPVAASRTLTLADVSDRSLDVLRSRRDIACVLVNPVQALHPNGAAPADSALIDSGRRAGVDREAYADWLVRLRAVCDARGIVLIFDEVFVGFRLARGGAQDYFGVRADLVTYGKALGGGLPVGVLCGRADLMRRYRDDRPADFCFARGTFNAHPHVMGAMGAFLRRLDSPEIAALYEGADARWDARAKRLNRLLAAEALPVEVANLQSIWTVGYLNPSRYNWMLQFYLRAEGIALSWIGTGRLIFSLACTDDEFDRIAEKFVAASRCMRDDGWWAPIIATNKEIRRRLLRDLLAAKWAALRPIASATRRSSATG